MTNEDATTRPTLDTILERINALGQELRGRMDSTDSRIGSMESEVAGLRVDVKKGFSDLGRKLDILNKEHLQMKGDISALDERITQLEEERTQH
jgi:predicted  nucleic acid-binding Zn-ribbon protein